MSTAPFNPAAARFPWLPLGALILALSITGVIAPRHVAVGRAQGPTSLDTLVAAERAFAAASVKNGMRDAFLFYLADDGILFRPGPVNGRSLWAPRANSKATLDWAPSYAEVSALGDMGFTTGPWELRGPPGDKEPPSYGHFVSVWKRGSDTPWKVAVDIGISHERPSGGIKTVELRKGPTHVLPKTKKPRSGFAAGGAVFGGGSGFGVGVGSGFPYRDEEYKRMAHEVHRMMSAERTLGFDLLKKGPGYAYPRNAAEDLRFYRNGSLPTVGVTPAIAALGVRKGARTWHPYSQGISGSYDLGYSYGLVETRAKGAARPDTSSYVHLWRRDEAGKWMLMLDVENEFPNRR
ncbi:MAG TPA: nuclear transport factor 2 family protein [Candidatus Limnocylindria bacterium]|nr:nuclear transport factor 2 family protein [Candidatus Limnocylindria bacterium]